MVLSMIPVLAYHEICEAGKDSHGSHKMDPSCFLRMDAFEQQMAFVQQSELKPMVLQGPDKEMCQSDRIVFTFDDGHIGNFELAYPILRKYDFLAVFFVTCDFIGKSGMMTWEQLRIMSEGGMSIQSHCVNHEPLETLSRSDLRYELQSSKEIIEDKIGREVRIMSLPHGSLHPKIREEAYDVGYHFICTSRIGYFKPSLNPAVTMVPRIPVPSKLAIGHFQDIVLRKGDIAVNWRRKQMIKLAIKKLIGINNYRKLYRLAYNIDRWDDLDDQ